MTNTAEVQMKPVEREYFVLSVKHTSAGNSYITLWAPENNGYRGRIETAGRYPERVIKASLDYYNCGENIAVPCDVLEPHAVPVQQGFFDDDNGHWLLNYPEIWRAALANTIAKPKYKPEPDYCSSPRKGASHE